MLLSRTNVHNCVSATVSLYTMTCYMTNMFIVSCEEVFFYLQRQFVYIMFIVLMVL